MSAEIKVTPSSVAVSGGKGVRVVPQFVSILNSKGLEPSVGAEKKLSPVSSAPLSCVGSPKPPCYGGCYGGRIGSKS